MSKKVSIIGCGNIGFPLAKLLLKKGYFVNGSTTRENRLPLLQQQGIKPYLINIGDNQPIMNDFLKTDIVVITFPPSSNGSQGCKTYSEQLQFLAMQLQRAEVKKVIFTSSTDLYPQLGTWVSEQDEAIIPPRFTDTPVLTLEQILTTQISFNTTILRLAGLIRPAFKRGANITGQDIKGAEDLINMVHQDDCVSIMHKIIQRDIWGETFNVVADKHPSKREYYNQLCDLQGLDRPNFIAGKSAFRIVSNQKLKKALNYQFLYPDPLDGLMQ